jgi:hypothetical protein
VVVICVVLMLAMVTLVWFGKSGGNASRVITGNLEVDYMYVTRLSESSES